MKYLIIAMALLLGACSEEGVARSNPNEVVTDQCLRAKLAQQCLKDAPAGPMAAKYNDWDEVVNQCDTNAMYQSRRRRQYVLPECAL